MKDLYQSFAQIDPKVIIKLSPETIQLLTEHGNVVDNTFYSLPYWFKKTDKEGVFEVMCSQNFEI